MFKSLVEDIAVDWVANNLYYVDTLNRRVEVFDLDSNYGAVLLYAGPHTAPKAIVVDPSTRWVKIYLLMDAMIHVIALNVGTCTGVIGESLLKSREHPWMVAIEKSYTILI